MFINHHFLPLNGQKWLRTSQETRPLTNSLKTIYKFSYLQDVIEAIQNHVFTENFVRACEIWNQIALNSIDISKENIKMYTQALTTMESYHRNLITFWNSYLIRTFGK